MKSSFLTLMRDLRLRRGRERRGLALAEGVRLVEEAIDAGIAIRGAAVSPSLETTPRGSALKAALEGAGVRLETMSADELDALAGTEHPQGVIAIVEPRRWTLQDMDLAPHRPVLVLDAVQDPGNVGTMIRTALGLGAAGVVALKGTAELTNPKVVRGTMGAIFRLPCVPTTEPELLDWVRVRGAELWVAMMDGAPVAPAPDPPAVCLAVGNEGAGVGPALTAAADRRVSIPLRGAAESLNVAVAAGILLHEVIRER